MNQSTAIGALGALAQDTRLAIFRRLVAEGPFGLPAGDLARELGVQPPNLSFHLNRLAAAGLLRARRDGRQVYYAIDVAAVRGLLAFLTQDCCGGQPDLCLPAPAPCCPPAQSKRSARSRTRKAVPA